VRPLRPRKDRRSGAALAGWTVRLPHLEVLITQQLHTGSPMLSPAPVMPEERRPPNGEGMEEDTDLARLCCSSAIPLALLAQWTGTTTANAGSIHHAQAPIGFSALFMRDQLLGSLATQRPIGLESKVLSREATSASCAGPREGEHSPREEPCAVEEAEWVEEVGWQEQTRSCARYQDATDAPTDSAEVPDPLRDQLPAFLSPGRVRAPAIGVLLQCAA